MTAFQFRLLKRSMLNMELIKPIVQYQQLPWASTVAKALFLVSGLRCFGRNRALVEANATTLLYFQHKGIALKFSNIAVSSTDGNNIVALLQLFDELLGLLLFLLLWPDHEE